MANSKQQSSRIRHTFLVETFFAENKTDYEEKEIGNWVLVKHINGDTRDYEVAIYSKESFKAYKDFNNKNSLFSE